MSREKMIRFIMDKEEEYLLMSSEVQDGWCEHVLLNGIKGLNDYTNDELKQKVEELKDGN